VFCFNDLMAIGVLEGARSLNLRVPQDLSVVGFDDIRLARYAEPALTTVRQDFATLGRRASQMLLDLVEGRDTAAPILLRTELVERESTASL
jgi:LacI family transcriptional regulator